MNLRDLKLRLRAFIAPRRLIAGSGLAAGLAIVLMSTPVASEIGGIVHVFDPVAYAASLTCIVTACVLAASIPALRAARIDPMRTSRQE